jgi:hypothetical protein
MINYNLAGKALIHYLKVPQAKLLLVGEDPALRARIEEAQQQIEGELVMKIQILDPETIQDVRRQKAKRPGDIYRNGVRGDWPMVMFFTRCVAKPPAGNSYADAKQRHDRNAKRCSLQHGPGISLRIIRTRPCSYCVNISQLLY